jgi:hypothetical protein
MSKPTVSAAGGAMPASGQENPDPAPSLNLLELVDEISKIRSLIECAWMAGASLPKDECNAIQTVLGDAERRLADVQGKINSARGAPAEDREDD